MKNIILMTLDNLEQKFQKNEKILKIIKKYKDQVNEGTFDYQDVLDKGWSFLSNIGVVDNFDNVENLFDGDNNG